METVINIQRAIDYIEDHILDLFSISYALKNLISCSILNINAII